MRPNLEDLEIGPPPKPGEGYRWEPSLRHVRADFNGEVVADSRRVMLLIEPRHLPVFYFPLEDVRRDLLEPTDHHTSSALKGEAHHWHVKVGDRTYNNVAWTYHQPTTLVAPIAGMICFYNERVDALYDEDELMTKPKTQWSE